jgi:hypothetical protein
VNVARLQAKKGNGILQTASIPGSRTDRFLGLVPPTTEVTYSYLGTAGRRWTWPASSGESQFSGLPRSSPHSSR